MNTSPLRFAAIGVALVLGLSGCFLQSPQTDKTGFKKAGQSPSSVAEQTVSPSLSPDTPSQEAAPQPDSYTPHGPKTGVTPPVADPGAHEQTEEGLYLFAEYWAATFNYALETGDFKPLEGTLSSRLSERWSEIIAPRKDVYTLEGWIEGNTLSVSRLNSPLSNVGQGAQAMVITIEFADGVIHGVDPKTGEDYTYKFEGEPSMRVAFIAEYIDGNWKFITTTKGMRAEPTT